MISVDQAICTGCGICVDMCPEVFMLNADGRAEAFKHECDHHSLEEVADACPVEAIDI